MLQYLVILLDDISVSYCHATNPLTSKNRIPYNVLHDAIFWGMRHNLMIQYVMPPYELPDEYCRLMETIDNVKIGEDVEVYQGIPNNVSSSTVVLSISIDDMIENAHMIGRLLKQVKRLTVNFTDIQQFRDDKINQYESALQILMDVIVSEISEGNKRELNLLTDRISLTKMSNCNAGVTNITVAPNGKFYLCPAFYYDEMLKIDTGLNYNNPVYDRSIGNLKQGLDIKNSHLLQLKNCPLCQLCDSYQCNRCLWLNQKITQEINTPGHEQCILSHIERNVSRKLSAKMRDLGYEAPIIPEINYLDPFDII